MVTGMGSERECAIKAHLGLIEYSEHVKRRANVYRDFHGARKKSDCKVFQNKIHMKTQSESLQKLEFASGKQGTIVINICRCFILSFCVKIPGIVSSKASELGLLHCAHLIADANVIFL